MEMTYQLENQAPRRKNPTAHTYTLHHLKEYPNYLCNHVESYISLCLLGWQEYTKELYKKDLHYLDNHEVVITQLEPDILECGMGLRKHHYEQS